MVAVKIPARNIIFQVQAVDGVTWLSVGYINDLTVDPSTQSVHTDVTTFDSAGNYEERVMQRGATITLAGFRSQDSVTAAQDAGQARLDTLAVALGEAGVGSVRFRYGITDPTWKVWSQATVEDTQVGGKNNDESSWGVKIIRSGGATTTSAP